MLYNFTLYLWQKTINFTLNFSKGKSCYWVVFWILELYDAITAGCYPSSQTPSLALVFNSTPGPVWPWWRNATARSSPLKWRTFSWNERYSSNNGWSWPRNYSISPTPSLSSTSSVPSYFSSVWWMNSNGIISSMKNVSMLKGELG